VIYLPGSPISLYITFKSWEGFGKRLFTCHFRLILIAEMNTVYEKFPTPLINRLEKHFVLTSSILKDWQEEVLVAFNEWIKNFSTIRYHLIFLT
jgi:hypothetical protein